jgi:hypothetical protein
MLKKEYKPQDDKIPNSIRYELYRANFKNENKKEQMVPLLHITNKK